MKAEFGVLSVVLFDANVSAGHGKLILNGMKIFAKAQAFPIKQLCRHFDDEHCMQRPLFKCNQDKLCASSE